MKKLTLTLVMLLSLGFGAMAQDNGLFNLGFTTGGDSDPADPSSSSFLSLPSSHGGTDDENAPLGTGTAILLGMGAAYLVTKKRNQE